MDVPREVIFRHAFGVAAKFFAEKIEQERREGKVAVLVKDFTHSLFFMPCKDNGYPQNYYLKTLHIPRIAPILMVSDIESMPDLQVEELTVTVERPLLSQSYDYREPPIVFMWEGRVADRTRVPIENLDVGELMRAAQVAIGKREGLIVDEVLKNKIYK